jgi:hypothetical protein
LQASDIAWSDTSASVSPEILRGSIPERYLTSTKEVFVIPLGIVYVRANPVSAIFADDVN